MDQIYVGKIYNNSTLIWHCMQCSLCQVLAYLSKSCTHKVVSLCPHQANIFNISWLLACCLGSILSLSLMLLLIFVSEEVTILEWWYHLLWETNSVLQFWFQHYVSQNNIARISSHLYSSYFKVFPLQVYKFPTSFTLYKSAVESKMVVHFCYDPPHCETTPSCMAVHLSSIRLAKAVCSSHQSCLPCFGSFNASRARR